jgi:hypothetical protein
MERIQTIELINRFFIAVDNHDWEKVESMFTPVVHLDYSSMNGQGPSDMPSKDIVESWKNFLPGFDSTHHQWGNFLVEAEGAVINLYCYGTADHYIQGAEGGEVWTVTGSYDFIIKNENEQLSILAMKFIKKFISGNEKLPVLAQDRAAHE